MTIALKRAKWIWLGLLPAVIVVIVVGLSQYCSRSRFGMEKLELPSIASVPPEQWDNLADKRIFFAHMSVGRNIIDGMKLVLAENKHIKLKIVDVADASQGPALVHAMLGHNADPQAKIASFEKMADTIAAGNYDIALMKFCYVDIVHDSDIEALFTKYMETISRLKAIAPDTKFMHCTVPICSTPIGLKKSVKSTLKSLAGKPVIADDNMKRQDYNDQIRREETVGVGLFDIALAESTTSEGNTCFVSRSGQKIPTLVMDYTTDGGHLNETGQKRVGEQMLIALAKLAGR